MNFELHPEVIGTLIAIGALLFIAARQAMLWRISRDHTHWPWLAITMCGIGFAVVRVIHQSCVDPDVALTMIRIHFAIAMLLPGLALATVEVINEVPLSRTVFVCILGAIPLQLACIATPWLISGPVTTHYNLFGHPSFGARTGWMILIVIPMCIGVVIAMRARILAMPPSFEKLRRNFRIAVAVFVVLGVHDTLVGAGVFRSILVFEYAFVAFGVIAANFEVRATAILHAELEELIENKREEVETQTQTLDTARRRLERTQVRYQHLADATREGVVLCRQRRVLDANRAICELVGTTERGLLNSDVRELVAEGDRRALDRLLIVEPGPIEVTFPRRDGTTLAVSIKAIPAPNGSHGTRVLLIRDVSGERDLQARLATADRLAAIGTLAAGTAHEINNPLTFVLGNAEMLAETLETLRPRLDAATASTCIELIGEVCDGADRIRRVVQDLMTLARDRRGDERAVELDQTLDRCIAMAGNQLRHRARVVKAYGRVPTVFASEGRLFQVFLNLIVNAGQSIPEGHLDANEVRISTHIMEDVVVVEIADTGAGMTESVMAHIFEPYFTTKEIGHGTGLGLSISQGIITNLGGSIAVTSEVGKGTTFRVSLPAMPAGTVVPVAKPMIDGSASRLRVLIVDDELPVARGLARMLGSHEVDIAHSGRAAFARLQGHRYDVALCDLMMPDVTGMELHARLVAAGDAIVDRFVFMTGGVFSKQACEFLERIGSQHWVSKPIPMAELRQLVIDVGTGRGRGAFSRADTA